MACSFISWHTQGGVGIYLAILAVGTLDTRATWRVSHVTGWLAPGWQTIGFPQENDQRLHQPVKYTIPVLKLCGKSEPTPSESAAPACHVDQSTSPATAAAVCAPLLPASERNGSTRNRHHATKVSTRHLDPPFPFSILLPCNAHAPSASCALFLCTIRLEAGLLRLHSYSFCTLVRVLNIASLFFTLWDNFCNSLFINFLIAGSRRNYY